MWLGKQCSQLGHNGKVYFALRDAAPLMESAKILWQGTGLTPVGVYANRPLLGVEDEISPEIAHVNGEMKQYFESVQLTDGAPVVWSDTGAWGTVIKVLKQGVLSKQQLHPFFWYTHNPYIPGYLNQLIAKAGIDPAFGEVLNDSLECVFPQQFTRPTQLIKTGETWNVNLQQSGYLSSLWGAAALQGVKNAAQDLLLKKTPPNEVQLVEKLLKAHYDAKKSSVSTGVLPSNTPTWSKGEEFLASWSPNLLP